MPWYYWIMLAVPIILYGFIILHRKLSGAHPATLIASVFAYVLILQIDPDSIKLIKFASALEIERNLEESKDILNQIKDIKAQIDSNKVYVKDIATTIATTAYLDAIKNKCENGEFTSPPFPSDLRDKAYSAIYRRTGVLFEKIHPNKTQRLSIFSDMFDEIGFEPFNHKDTSWFYFRSKDYSDSISAQLRLK